MSAQDPNAQTKKDDVVDGEYADGMSAYTLSPGDRVDDETYREIQELREFLGKLADPDRMIRQDEGDDLTAIIREWESCVQQELSLYEREVPADEASILRDYTSFALESSDVEKRRAHVHIDNQFGGLVPRIRDNTQLMLSRVAAGRQRCFIRTALEVDSLVWRRSRSFPFPHPLPYLSTPPTTLEGRAVEEGGVIEAALRFALGKPSPGVDLYIDWFSQGPSSDNFWVLGSALVNLYNGSRILRINLNARAYAEAGFSDNVWAGTIAHEILHNLGWGHPVGGYVPSVAIVNYDRCIRSATGLRLEDGDFVDVTVDRKLVR